VTDSFLQAAIDEALAGRNAGGIPIGSVLVIDGRIVGRGHNQRVQQGSAIRHAEMDCLENAGRLPAADYRRGTLYSTLSPCDMCSGAILLYGIPRVVVGEHRTFKGPEEYVRSRGVEVVVVDDPTCRQMMERFIAEQPRLWCEDIGEE
jgi:cytosine deaminase